MSRSFILLNIILFSLSIQLTAQGIFQEKNNFTRQDTLRGAITAERSWWDLNYYHLDIKVDPENKSPANILEQVWRVLIQGDTNTNSI